MSGRQRAFAHRRFVVAFCILVVVLVSGCAKQLGTPDPAPKPSDSPAVSTPSPAPHDGLQEPLGAFRGTMAPIAKERWAPVVTADMATLPPGIRPGDMMQYCEWQGTLDGQSLQMECFYDLDGKGAVIGVKLGQKSTAAFSASVQPVPVLFFDHYAILFIRAGGPYYQLLDLITGTLSEERATPAFVHEAIAKAGDQGWVVVH